MEVTLKDSGAAANNFPFDLGLGYTDDSTISCEFVTSPLQAYIVAGLWISNPICVADIVGVADTKIFIRDYGPIPTGVVIIINIPLYTSAVPEPSVNIDINLR